MPNFSVPLSGLDASSAALSTCANNLANLNTVGYKDQQIQFADLFYQNLGSDGAGDPIHQGAGVEVSSQPSKFPEGDVTSTGIDTDCAINGNGFFVVRQDGVQSYTRAGNFEVGTDNLLETSDGQQVMGYAATNGAVSTSAGLSTLALGAGIASPAVVTTEVSLTSNLRATAAPASTYSTQATIYDSLGAAHQVTFNFTNAGAPAINAVNAVTAQAATGTLTTSGGGAGNTILNGSTVSVGGVTYTFMTGPVGTTANAVLIGATDTANVGNLVDSINPSTTSDTNATGGGATTDFGTATTANPLVTAAQSSSGSFTFTAKTAGATVVPTSTSNSAVLSWKGGAGANGVNAVTAVATQAATGTLTMTAVPATTQSLVIGNQTYTFTATTPPGTGTNDVYQGTTVGEATANLVNAINGNYGDQNGDISPDAYGTGTQANPDVIAQDLGNGVIQITAITDSGSNDFATSSTGTGSTNLTWSDGAGTNGVDGVNAVTAQQATGTLTTSADPNATGGGATTDFGTDTVANPQVTAAASSNGTFTFMAKTAGATPVAVASSNTAILSWNGGAGANGVNAVTAVAAAPAVVNTWTYAVTLPAADVSGANVPVTLATGTLVFNGNGTLQSVTPTSGTASSTNPTITVPPVTTPASVFADGANPLTFTWDVFGTSGAGLVTQTAAASSTTSIQQNGAASGTLQNFSIGSDGTITGSFSNGTTATVGQIALASFADEQGLSRNGNNDFTPTLASGQATIGAPTSGGLGSISGGSLEASNVDIATEFANLIVAQRSYEANARVVTTFDQIAQATIALKQ